MKTKPKHDWRAILPANPKEAIITMPYRVFLEHEREAFERGKAQVKSK